MDGVQISSIEQPSRLGESIPARRVHEASIHAEEESESSDSEPGPPCNAVRLAAVSVSRIPAVASPRKHYLALRKVERR